MSNKTNDELLERAGEIAEDWVGTFYQKQIDLLIERGDLDELRRVVTEAENAPANDHREEAMREMAEEMAMTDERVEAIAVDFAKEYPDVF